MSTGISCGNCNKTYRIKTPTRRKQFQCKSCGHTIKISARSAGDADDFLDTLDDASDLDSDHSAPASKLPPSRRKRKTKKKTRPAETPRKKRKLKEHEGWLPTPLRAYIIFLHCTLIFEFGWFIKFLGEVVPKEKFTAPHELVILGGTLILIGLTTPFRNMFFEGDKGWLWGTTLLAFVVYIFFPIVMLAMPYTEKALITPSQNTMLKVWAGVHGLVGLPYFWFFMIIPKYRSQVS